MTDVVHAALPDTPLAGRFRLSALLGSGATGSVYRAEDLHHGGHVAVKILLDDNPRLVARLEREARALRTLSIPGVARLLAQGSHDGRRFLVMDLAEGERFPGRPGVVPWATLAPTALALLDTLARVHDAGILHRDLNPSNVLVDADGAPTVLDFGLARFLAGTSSLTRTCDAPGTPRYQAPEQFLADRPVDTRADLYAVGLMLYEALAGAAPYTAPTAARLYARRLLHPAPALAPRAPGLPPEVAEVIEQLIARSPDDRPASARAVRDAFARIEPVRPAGLLPWLGGDDAVTAALDALGAGRSVVLVGGRGSGRSRLVRRIGGALQAAGRAVYTPTPGDRPWESLAAALGPCASAEEARSRLIAQQPVLLVDDTPIDPWSSTCVEAAGTLRVVSAQALDGALRIPLGALPVAALEPLFNADARERAALATLLHTRTAGVPARIAAEVGGWVANGQACWLNGRLAVSRETRWRLAFGPPPDPRLGRREPPGPLPPLLADMLGWVVLAEPHVPSSLLARARNRPAWEIELELTALEEHGLLVREGQNVRIRADVAALDDWTDVATEQVLLALAHATEPGAPEHLRRLLAAGAGRAALDEALRRAEAALDAGHPAEAWATAAWAETVAVEDGLTDPRLVPLYARAALAVRTRTTLEATHAAALRAEEHRIAALLFAALGGDLPPLGPIDDPALQRQVLHHQLLGAHAAAPEVAARLLDAGTARGEADPAFRLAWEARLRLAGGRPEEAVVLLLRAQREPAGPIEALDLAVLLAEAQLSAGMLADARATAHRVAGEAETRELPVHARHAATLLRDAEGRAGALEPADAAEVEASAALGSGPLLARTALVEAVRAWRTSSYEEALRHARRAATAAPATPDGILARALSLACEAGPLVSAGMVVLAEADASGDPSVALQVRGLLALALPAQAAALGAEAAALADGLGRLDDIREVLSVREALAFCRSRAPRRGAPPGG